MIYPFVPMWPILSVTAEPSGGCHGTRHQTDRGRMGRLGSSAIQHTFGGCFSQLFDRSDVRFARDHRGDRRHGGMQRRDRQADSQALPPRRPPGAPTDQTSGASQPGHARVPRRDEAGRRRRRLDKVLVARGDARRGTRPGAKPVWPWFTSSAKVLNGAFCSSTARS